MKSRNRYDGIHPSAITLIRREAVKLARHPAFGWADREDFEQELALHVLDRLRCFDGSRAGLKAFLSHVIRNHAIHMLERETAVMRGGGFVHVSLNEPLLDEEGAEVERIETISETQGLWCNGPHGAQRLENHLEAEALLGLLPPDLQTLAIRFAFDSITGVSRSTGIPRATLYDAMNRARRVIQKKTRPHSDVFPAIPVCRG